MRGVRSGGRRTIFVNPWSKPIAAMLPLHDDKLQYLMVEWRPIGVLVMAGSFLSSRLLCQKGGSYVASTWRFKTLPPAARRWCSSHPSALVSSPAAAGLGQS